MNHQTPVQIAWVTRDLDATEQALTALLGAKKWVRMGLHHICVETPDVTGFDAAVRAAERQGAPVVAQGLMPGGLRFAYVSAAEAGVPYLEIAHVSPEIRAFFDGVKQEQQ